jgi:solute carrier family 25 folate transporter 32
MSGASKLVALSITYPYQVIRSRIQVGIRGNLVHNPKSDYYLQFTQNNATTHLYPTIPATIKRTWANEGRQGFYRGLGTNLVRVLPGTCVTFVVYENLAYLLRTSAARRAQRQGNTDI